MEKSLNQFIGEQDRGLYLPILFSLSMRLEHMVWQEIESDAVLVAFALRNGITVFNTNGVINWFDTWMEAEALGLDLSRDENGQVLSVNGQINRDVDPEQFVKNGQVSIAVDVAKRLSSELAERSVVFGYLTGGSTMAEKCFPQDLKQKLFAKDQPQDISDDDKGLIDLVARCSLQMAREYCESGATALLLVEEIEPSKVILDAYEPLFNLANYYSIPVLSLHREPPSKSAAAVLEKFGCFAMLNEKNDAEEGNVVLSESIFLSADGSDAELNNIVSNQNRLITTYWDLPFNSKLERVAEIGRTMTN